MGLNRKDIYLLEEINQTAGSIKYFADEYSVSERNIRYSIDNINFYLKKEKLNLIEIKKGNLELNIKKEVLDNFITNLNINTYTFLQEERENYILVKFLFEKNPTIKEIEEFLNVSRTTIKKDIKSLEEYLSQFDLYFARYENRIEISGNEKKLRHLKLLKLLDYAEIKNKKLIFLNKKYFNEKIESFVIKDYIKKYFKQDIVIVIDKIEKGLKTKFPDEFKNIMGLYLTATLDRIENNYIITRKSNSSFLSKVDEYKIIKKVLQKLINADYEFEHLHLTEYFLSGQYLNYFYENIFIAERFIIRMLRTLEKHLNRKLLVKKELSEKLLQYLIPAIYRVKNNFCLNKELNYDNVDKNILEAVNKTVLENNKYLLEPLRDEEILHIAEYIEKFIIQENQKKISLKELMKIIRKNAKEIDIENMAADIKEKFAGSIDDDFDTENYHGFLSILKKDRIYISANQISFFEAAETGMQILLKNKCIKETSTSSLKFLIENYGKYMFIESKILLCYDPNSENCIKSGLAVVMSKNGIKVDKDEEANILFVLSAKNKMEHLKIISELMDLAENKNLLKNIIKAENSSEIDEIIRKTTLTA